MSLILDALKKAECDGKKTGTATQSRLLSPPPFDADVHGKRLNRYFNWSLCVAGGFVAIALLTAIKHYASREIPASFVAPASSPPPTELTSPSVSSAHDTSTDSAVDPLSDLISLHVDGHIYFESQPGRSVVLLNGLILRVGDRLENGALIAAIESDSVTLEYGHVAHVVRIN